jgi:hypothetical protein
MQPIGERSAEQARWALPPLVGTTCRYGFYYPMPTDKDTDNDIIQDDRGQDQPKNKKAAQKRGVKEQKESAKKQQESPGEPAGGE